MSWTVRTPPARLTLWHVIGPAKGVVVGGSVSVVPVEVLGAVHEHHSPALTIEGLLAVRVSR